MKRRIITEKLFRCERQKNSFCNIEVKEKKPILMYMNVTLLKL